MPASALKSAANTPDAGRGSTAAPEAIKAVGRLVATHGPKLHRLALRLCGHHADAEDMVQSVFVQALRKWHTFRGHADPGTWLYAIAARACKARTRRKGGIDRRQPALSQLMPWTETTVMEIAAAPEGRESKAERNEAVRRVQAEIARLPEHLRLPLVLKDVLEMPADDVAASLGLAENTVKTRIHRARLALRKAMTARSSAVEASPPIYEKQVCFDLLKAKMDAMDRGGTAAGQRVPQAEVCARCRAVFRELDIVQDACAKIGEGEMPAPLRNKILKALSDHARASRGTTIPARRGRKPVAGKLASPGKSRVR
jgi:RNA polymerase sigma-70 factor (ECF subfamily)